MLRLAVVFGLILVAFDAVAAIIANAAGINYGSFTLLGLVIYAALGIFAGQRLRWWRAVVAVIVAALIDSSLGWYVAALIGPGRPAAGTGMTEIVGTALLAGLLDALFGAIGVAVGTRVTRRVT
jgi:hypothetical protein